MYGSQHLFLIFWPACEIFIPRSGPSAVKAQSLNHWTAMEFLEVPTLKIKNCDYFGGRPGVMNGMRLLEGNWGFLAKLFFLTWVKF